MEKQKIELVTPRLRLRPFKSADAGAIRRLANDKEIARTTLSIPYPFTKNMAEKWIDAFRKPSARKRNISWAVTLGTTKELIGSISLLGIDECHRRAEIGYWIGKSYWNQGYVTEAAGAVLRYGFAKLKLNRIFGYHFANNPASGRIMQKIGMQPEGTLRKHVKKWGRFIDLEIMGILSGEWAKRIQAKSLK